ncbi:hypothetical protein V8G54_017394, partial [Vigna mungo]
VFEDQEEVSVGIISPYKAQVYEIQQKVKLYISVSDSHFSISVRSVDGSQGGEEDIIILSTVRSNGSGKVVIFPRYINMHIVKGLFFFYFRYCPWKLGNAATLINSNFVWRELVLDAKERDCFHNADENNKLGLAIEDAILGLELDESQSQFKKLTLVEKSVIASNLSR